MKDDKEEPIFSLNRAVKKGVIGALNARNKVYDVDINKRNGIRAAIILSLIFLASLAFIVIRGG